MTNNAKAVRVRYAPSPTGFQHIGGLRTALFNYLFARSNKTGDTSLNKFIVRVEDTDLQRSQEKYLQDLFDVLDWIGITADEYLEIGPYAPYVQSLRSQLYKEYANKLVEKGQAYYCFTSHKHSDEKVRENNRLEKFSQYDRSSRDLTAAQQDEYRQKGIVPVIRLKLPLEGSITFTDMLLGEIVVKCADIIVDPIILKSDGLPTYHLANVIDDHIMHISHVIRSQEWVPTTPVHVYLYKMFNWQMPQFYHLPMVLGADGQKLSKRNGSVSVTQLRTLGILPEAIINCITMLGWALDGQREFFTLKELEDCFDRGSINKAPAQFSMEKLLWYNAHYIKQTSDENLTKHVYGFLDDTVKTKMAETKLVRIMPLIKERITSLCDVNAILIPLCVAPVRFDADDFLLKKLDLNASCKKSIEGLKCIKKVVLSHWNDDIAVLEQSCRDAAKEQGLGMAAVLMPFRVVIVGSRVSPPILPFAQFLNVKEVIDRIEFGIHFLENLQKEMSQK